MKKNKGFSNIFLLLILFFLLITIILGFKVGSFYMEKYTAEKAIEETFKYIEYNKINNNKEIKSILMNKLKVNLTDISEEDIIIEKKLEEVIINVDIDRSIEVFNNITLSFDLSFKKSNLN